jgi:hypothetical protein
MVDRFDRRRGLKRQNEAEKRQAWRDENSERLRWEMFLRTFGPEGDFDHLGELPQDAEEEAAFAHREMLQRILRYYGNDGTPDYESMSFEEKAFAHLLDVLYTEINSYSLLDSDIDYWRFKLNIDLPHFPELISRIDKYLGSSDWREICYSQEVQNNLMAQFSKNWELMRVDVFRHRSEDPNFEYQSGMDRPDE